ncbi:YXWGXW repeat-containing protein [Luteibacter rhizovicinus]|uniref:YXWGXW repeat-containing protein n=1 Tax=Luteibacter rhizovicinus TaxID=242606 RepID=A0A4R3YYX2_9GAMM|nr:YXWGXW repeat-containing protein [Luteibacter rhizovicinus]TCV97078.1 YXWGXW repeat-containing protein [Luteibacter rhizovicinus]
MTTLTRKLALLAGLGLAVGATAYVPPAAAQGYVSVTVGTRPPPPRYERRPPPRSGYVWAPGYWNWAGGRYIWIGGRWYGSRPGYIYRPPVYRPYGHAWRYERERWDRDPQWRGRR